MIERYNTPELKMIWSDENKINIWKNVSAQYVYNLLLSFKNNNSLTYDNIIDSFIDKRLHYMNVIHLRLIVMD